LTFKTARGLEEEQPGRWEIKQEKTVALKKVEVLNSVKLC
jgi:hypothetical protein